MFVFGVAFSGDVTGVNVVIVNHDQGLQTPNGTLSLSNNIISNLNTTVMNIQYMDDENNAVAQVENGKDYAVIIFPENFTKNAYLGLTNPSSGSNTQITIRDDESRPNIKNAIQHSIASAITTTVQNQGIKSPVTIH